MDIVNEKTSAYITVSFLDKNGAPAVPTSITYSTRCLSTGAQIKNAINVTPAASIQITLDALDNAIQAAQNPSELKLLTGWDLTEKEEWPTTTAS
ncbi:MAG: hypothetical protein HY306_07525 [Nitrosomonadales bacterium]|nr:hypothetical protein [Nitrosomonadales bacterium]